jgi:hypothetical protein
MTAPGFGTFALSAAAAALALIAAGCGDESTGPGNTAPAISAVVAIPDTINAGGATMLRCTASDPDGDPLDYSWASAYGEITGTGPVVTWEAPVSTGDYWISISVSDHGGLTAADSVMVSNQLDTGTLLVATDRGLTAIRLDGSSFVLRPDLRKDVEVVERRIYCLKHIYGPDTLFEISLQGETVRSIPIPAEIPYPYRNVAIPDGRFALLDNDGDRIDFIDSEGNLLQTVMMPDPSPEELQWVSGVVVGNNLVVSETGGNKLVRVDLATYEASIFWDLASLGSWLGDIDFWNKQYWFCQPSSAWRLTSDEGASRICSYAESNLVGMAVVGSAAYTLINCSPSKLYRTWVFTAPCEPDLLASDLGYPVDIEYIPVWLEPSGGQ